MRRAVAATMQVEETQPEAVEAATAATRLLVDSVEGAATVQPPEEAADATSAGPGWREEIVDMKTHLLEEREPRCEAKADMDAVVRCIKAEMLTKADLQIFEKKEGLERFVAKEDLHRISDGKDKIAMDIEDTVTKARVDKPEVLVMPV